MFYIHEQEWVLIESAIKFAKWTLEQPELTNAEQNKVKNLIMALENLPNVTSNVNCGIEFKILDNDIKITHPDFRDLHIGYEEIWCVDYSQIIAEGPSKGECWLEIFNIRNTEPQRSFDDFYDTQYEFSLNRKSKDTEQGKEYKPSTWELARMYDWINRVDAVDWYKKHRSNFEISVD